MKKGIKQIIIASSICAALAVSVLPATSTHAAAKTNKPSTSISTLGFGEGS